jgi:hypothetical protein
MTVGRRDATVTGLLERGASLLDRSEQRCHVGPQVDGVEFLLFGLQLVLPGFRLLGRFGPLRRVGVAGGSAFAIFARSMSIFNAIWRPRRRPCRCRR